MRVRDLGALTVAVDQVERPVAGTRAAAILALLVINANQRVSIDSLLEATWGHGATDATVSTLESHIWRLRQLLEPDRAKGQPPTVLINEAGGYRLIADGHSIDSVSFEQIAGDVRDLLAAGRAANAVLRAEEALTLWRGQPYGALGEQPWAQAAVARLEEMRRQLGERRIDALIAVGQLDQALADLEPLIAATPFRETLRAQQMLALYRSGRTEEALSAFQRARTVLIDEVGSDPGPELQALHAKILDHDTDLGRTPREPALLNRGAQVHLPSVLTPLVGRENDIESLSGLIEREPLVTIAGAAGAGKTRLAIDLARATADTFPDGVWFVDLASVTDAALVVDAAVSTIGLAASPGATPIEDLVNYVSARRLLLILDNCEHVVAEVAKVATMVVGQAQSVVQCTLLVTSREPLDVEGEITWTVQPLGLPAVDADGQVQPGVAASESPSVRLFLDRLRRTAPTLTIDDGVIARAGGICVAVDGLPLAIELAAARSRSHSLRDIESQLRSDLGELRRPGRGAVDHRATLRSSIEASHRLLTPSEQLVHRRLSVLPGAFGADAAAAVVDLSAAEVSDVLAQLVHRSMLTSTATSAAASRTSFRQLATVRAHAAHALREAGEAQSATLRRNTWTQALVENRPRLGAPDEPDWFVAVDDDYATVRATLAGLLIDEPTPAGSRLATALGFYWYYRAKVLEAGRWLELACEAVPDRASSEWLTAALVKTSLLAMQGRVEAARPQIREALGLVPAMPDARLVEVGEALVALAAGVWVHQVVDLVTDVYVALRAVAQRSADTHLLLFADAFECMAIAVAGRLDEAAERAADIYRAAEEAGNHTAGWMVAATPMTAALYNGQPEAGIVWVKRVMRAHLRVGGATAGMFIENRANYESQRGSHATAARLYAAARTHTRRAAMVWPRRPITDVMLQQTRNSLSQNDFEAAWRDGEYLDLAEIVRLD